VIRFSVKYEKPALLKPPTMSVYINRCRDDRPLFVVTMSGWLSHSLLQYQNREEVSIAGCEELCKMYSLQQGIAIVEPARHRHDKERSVSQPGHWDDIGALRIGGQLD